MEMPKGIVEAFQWCICSPGMRKRLHMGGLAVVAVFLVLYCSFYSGDPASSVLLSFSFLSRPSATALTKEAAQSQERPSVTIKPPVPAADDRGNTLQDPVENFTNSTQAVDFNRSTSVDSNLNSSFQKEPDTGSLQDPPRAPAVSKRSDASLVGKIDLHTDLSNSSQNLQKSSFSLSPGLGESYEPSQVKIGINSSKLNRQLPKEEVTPKDGEALHQEPDALERSTVNINSGAQDKLPSEVTIPLSSEKKKNQKKYRWRDKLENELEAAKEAIANVSPEAADPSLYGIIYHNVSAFSKSYEMMEKSFRVYVYREGRKPLVHTGPTKGIYASEGQFIERMMRSNRFVVKDPRKAHMFFLPYSVKHMVDHLYVPNSRLMLPLSTFITNYVDMLASLYPFWNRTEGADHFFVSCHDWGPATARDHAQLRKNAVKVVCNADLTEEFVLGKDASLPEIYVHSLKLRQHIGGPGPDKRPYLAFFAGQMHGRVRPTLINYWKDKDPDMKIYEVLPKAIARKFSYVQHMKSSKYCICAMGYEVNSPRIVESLYYDCVPVIIADYFVLPFGDVLNWNTFSVTIPESDIPNLKAILTSISDKAYRGMQNRLKNVRQHFIWHEEPAKYDAFHMILHSVWMSRLHQLEQTSDDITAQHY